MEALPAILGLPFFLFWMWMCVEAIRHEYRFRPFWIAVVLIGDVFGSAAFYFLVYRREIRSSKAAEAQFDFRKK
jgi:hypothetical protein